MVRSRFCEASRDLVQTVFSGEQRSHLHWESSNILNGNVHAWKRSSFKMMKWRNVHTVLWEAAQYYSYAAIMHGGMTGQRTSGRTDHSLRATQQHNTSGVLDLDDLKVLSNPNHFMVLCAWKTRVTWIGKNYSKESKLNCKRSTTWIVGSPYLEVFKNRLSKYDHKSLKGPFLGQ